MDKMLGGGHHDTGALGRQKPRNATEVNHRDRPVAEIMRIRPAIATSAFVTRKRSKMP